MSFKFNKGTGELLVALEPLASELTAWTAAEIAAAINSTFSAADRATIRAGIVV